MFRFGLLLIALMVFATAVNAQKVKYKDLYPLLAAKDYAQGEKYLRKFIVQDPEHANANLNMAYYYSFKMSESDLLQETDSYLAYGDSALAYYTKAYEYINEKEVKKNDDFYQDFYRRDLRTGKYGVKLGDVQLDTETRMEELRILQGNVGKIANFFNSFVHGYDTASYLYDSFTSRYETFPLFLFNTTEEDVQKMNEISDYYTKAITDFESYKKAISVLENPTYNQALEVKDIEEIAKTVSPDYYAAKVVVYNYAAWSENYGSLISGTMIPLAERMIGYNADLDELMKEAKNGKNATEALNTYKQGADFEVLTRYDTSPMPLALFDFKEKGIAYYSKESEKNATNAYDSMSYAYRKMLYDDAIIGLEVLGESYGTLQDQDFDGAEKLYRKFITAAYDSKSGLVLSIANMATALEAETNRILTQMDSIELATEYAVASNYSLPMSVPDSIDYSIQVESDTLYYSLNIDSLAASYWVSGYELTKSGVMAYTAEVSLMMEVDTLFTEELLKSELAVETLRTEKMPADSIHSFYVYYAQNAEKKSCIAQLIDTENSGISWSTNLKATLPLKYIETDEEGNLVVFFGDVVEGEEKSQIIKLNDKGKPI